MAIGPNSFPLAEAADRFGDCLAFVDDARETTYQELLDATARMASSLIASGIQPGERIGLLPDSTFQTIQTLWAVLGTGAVLCPINPRLPFAQRSALVRQVGGTRLLDSAALLDLTRNQAYQRPVRDWPNYSDSHPATILFSSGTTSAPKPVVHDTRAHICSALGSNENIAIQPGDCWLWSLPVYHVSGLSIVFRCTLAGASIMPMPEVGEIAAVAQRKRITHLSLVATQLRQFLEQSDSSSPGLKAVLLGGSALPPKLVESALAAGLPLRTTYGLTEMASQVTTTPPNSPWARRLTAGRVLPYREIAISPKGEILVKGATLCQGYLQQGTIDAVVDNAGWFRTGDLGTMDDGFLTVTGRLDNMFISGGENIHPEEIENCLLDLEGIRQAIVVPVADSQYGQRPFAFIDATELNESHIRDELRLHLPSFKIPIAMSSLPQDARADAVKPSRVLLRRLAERWLSNQTRGDIQVE